MIHFQQANIQHIHKSIPKAANLNTAHISIRIKIQNAFREGRKELLDLLHRPAARLPRFYEFFGQVEEEVAKLTRPMDWHCDCDYWAPVVAKVDVQFLVAAFQEGVFEAEEDQAVKGGRKKWNKGIEKIKNKKWPKE